MIMLQDSKFYLIPMENVVVVVFNRESTRLSSGQWFQAVLVLIQVLFSNISDLPLCVLSSGQSETPGNGLLCNTVLKVYGMLFRVRSNLVYLKDEPRSS